MMPTMIVCAACDLPLGWVPEERATPVLRAQMQDQHGPDCHGASAKLSPEQVEEVKEIANQYLKPQYQLP